eukprot:TRINITY_DN26847_c1_g2_i1.p1 TRINITY_DN26847_c1_g2~~TRINITY_DN26847_c1_g2_i1.p1  ORF type:complete len:731 (+),score=73.86 TRINITY_DN26847_c1_g2_i1:118-2310(+)
MLRVVRECDLFRKLPKEHREAAATCSSGGAFDLLTLVIRVLGAVVVLYLTSQETWAFANPASRQKFDLDMGETATAAPRKIRVLLDVTVHDYPCVDLSLDYQDVMGTRAVDVKTTVLKQRLHKNGTAVGTAERNDPKSLLGSKASNPTMRGNGTGNSSCGSCYGALPEGECCNTCSDVLYAYRIKRWSMPRIETITQCQNDGSAATAYQPPQILRLNDYKSDDFMPRFTRIGSDLQKSGSEARVSTPFKFNFTFPPLKPINWNIGNRSSRSGINSYGFQPLTAYNFSHYSPFKFDDLFDNDYGHGYYDSHRRRFWSTTTAPSQTAWPNCIWRNLMVHGWREDARLELNLTRFGATSGCWQNDCTKSDVFHSNTLERCSAACYESPECHWWTWGTDEGVKKCWLRQGRSGREKRFGFASGHRHCASPDMIKNGSNMSLEESRHSEQTRAVLEDNHTDGDHHGDYDYDYYHHDSAHHGHHGESGAAHSVAAQNDSHGLPAAQPRRLSSFDDDDQYRWGSSFHMPLFGGSDHRDQERRRAQKDESCRFHGYFDVNKVPGNFHIGAHGSSAPSYLSSYSYYGYGYNEESQAQKNMQHTINALAFVDVAHNETKDGSFEPLSGFLSQPLTGFESPKAFTFQYYIMITPATMRNTLNKELNGYQFKAGSFVTNELIGPAVYFRLDIDPIRVTYYKETIRWSKFLVNLCAIIGGCVALCSMLEQLLETMVSFTSEKD